MGLAIPEWNGIKKLLALNPSWWTVPLIGLGVLFDAILPFFYFALCRSREGPRISKRLGILALVAALALAANLAVDLPQWLKSLPSKTLAPRTVNDASELLVRLSTGALILLLTTIYRQASDDVQPRLLAPKLLRIATGIAVVALGVWAAFNIIRLPFVPFVFLQLRDQAAAQYRKPPPPIAPFIVETVRMVLVQVCVFVAPYIVWRSLSDRRKSDTPLEERMGESLR